MKGLAKVISLTILGFAISSATIGGCSSSDGATEAKNIPDNATSQTKLVNSSTSSEISNKLSNPWDEKIGDIKNCFASYGQGDKNYPSKSTCLALEKSLKQSADTPDKVTQIKESICMGNFMRGGQGDVSDDEVNACVRNLK
jgi:hypothetical protein